MLKIKFTKNINIINSNHLALYIKILAASVPCLLSTKVPIAIAAEKNKKRNAVSLVETRTDTIFLTIYWKNYNLYCLGLRKCRFLQSFHSSIFG